MSFRLANRAGQAVLLEGRDYWALGTDLMDALARPHELHDRWASRGTPDGQVSPSDLGPPVPHPKQVFAYGLNYRDHIEEMDEVDNLGKSRESFGPTGPALVSPDLVDNPDDLAISCRINGELRQNSRTRFLIRPVAEIVAYLSSILTLHPGDLIFTGTPGGVGQALGLYLQPGDVILSEIEGLGALENTCI